MISRFFLILFLFVVSCDDFFPPEPDLPPNPYDCPESEKDECGLCGGMGILDGKCDCEGNVLDDCQICGGENADNLGCGCFEPEPGCDDICGSNLEFDQCGICGGDDTFCADCLGVPNGSAGEDCLGVCNGNAVEDCNGECNGESQEDQCGVCNGDDSSCLDCSGIPNGLAFLDSCGQCVGGFTGFLENYSMDACGVCDGNNSSCADCLGVPNGSAAEDCLGVCNGNAVEDCAGECNGSAQYSGEDCVAAPVLLEDFSNISDWTALLQCGSSNFVSNCSVNYGGWESYGSGYFGGCAISDCNSFLYGNRLTKTFNFPSDGKLTFWYKRVLVSSYNNLYVLIDGEEVWSGTAYSWTKVEVPVSSGINAITFQVTQTGDILLDHLEYIQFAD